MEELWVTPIVWEMIYVNDFIRKKNWESVVDLRYEILNPNDFFQIDLESASHGFENSEVWFYDLSTISKQYQPENMWSILLNKKSHQ